MVSGDGGVGRSSLFVFSSVQVARSYLSSSHEDGEWRCW